MAVYILVGGFGGAAPPDTPLIGTALTRRAFFLCLWEQNFFQRDLRSGMQIVLVPYLAVPQGPKECFRQIRV